MALNGATQYATSIGFNRNRFLWQNVWAGTKHFPLLCLSIDSMSTWLVLHSECVEMFESVFWWNWAKKIHGSSWNDSNSSNGSISYFEIIHERMVWTQTKIVSCWYWWLFSLVPYLLCICSCRSVFGLLSLFQPPRADATKSLSFVRFWYALCVYIVRPLSIHE